MPESYEDKIDYTIKPRSTSQSEADSSKSNTIKHWIIYGLFVLSIAVILAVAIIQTRQVSLLTEQNKILQSTITSLQATIETLKTATPLP